MSDHDPRLLPVIAAWSRPARRRSARSSARLAAAIVLFAAASLLLHGWPVLAAEAAPAAAPAQSGDAIFQAQCAACHPDQGNVLNPAKPVRGSAKLKDLPTFISWIRVPVAPMTPFTHEMISDDQAGVLYRYLVPAAPPQP